MYITPRGDFFYYLEVLDKQESRDSKICDLFGLDHTPSLYISGSEQRKSVVKNLCSAIFWKSKEAALYRIERLKRFDENKDCLFRLRYLNREQFISIIPDEPNINPWEGGLKRNKKLRDSEISYLEKLKDKEVIGNWDNHYKRQ